MLKFTIKRLLSAIPVTLIVITMAFILIRFIPGDPTDMYLPEDATPEEVEEMRERLGLNDPIVVQYLRYLKNIITGNWGTSHYNQKPVFQNIFSRWEPTILLTLYSTTLAVVIGIPAGIISARHRNSPLDYCVTTVSALGSSAPTFWIGLMMVYLLGVRLQLFPVQGYTSIAEGGLLGALYSLTMPAFCQSIFRSVSISSFLNTG